MIIRLIPPFPHPAVLYGLTFPPVLSLPNICPGPTVPAAWSSQLQFLTSFLQLEPPSNIHMLDRAVGLVARVHEVTMDVPQKEFLLKFVDERVIHIPMDSDCVRMLLGVVVDVKGCSEPESQRNSMEGSACPGSTASSAEDVPLGGPKPPKPGKHKRQRSLLFSLISSLVPKSFSLPSPPPSSAPPPAPLPPLPISGRVTSPVSPQQISILSEHPDHLRRRARATLVEVWRRYVIPAVAPQHFPAAGYVEWTLIAIANEVRAEIEIETAKPGIGSPRTNGSSHRRTQSEARNALDFGDRSDDRESGQWRCRAPSPFPGALDTEDTDRVVYPRRRQADERGVRYVNCSRFIDEADVFAAEYNGHHGGRLGEHFAVGDDWDDAEGLTFELMGRQGATDIDDGLSSFDDSREFVLDCSHHNGGGLADTAFDISRCPLTPSDVNDDEQSDDSLISFRTPGDGQGLPVAAPMQGSAQYTICSTSQSSLVLRVDSSRPRSRSPSAQFLSTPSGPAQISHPPTLPTPPSPGAHHIDCRNTADEFIASRLAFLDRICTALEIVRSRAREEGWRLVRATLIGAKNGWMDEETERSLETKAKRRAWSSGIKVSAPYYSSRSVPKVWDGTLLTSSSPIKPPGLASSKRVPRVHRPIVPTGLSLGLPLRSSPLALYAWGASDGQKSTSIKCGILTSGRMDGAESKRLSRVSFANNIAKLFPVCEDEGEDSFESVQVNAVGFPQAVPVSVGAEGLECSLTEELAGQEEDPFYCPSRPRERTRSMYMISPASPPSPSPVLPMFRPSTPPPSYQVAIGGDVPAPGDDEGRLDASALLLQPLSSLSISSPSQSSSSRPPLVSSPSFAPRPRAVSLPAPRSYSGATKTRRTSFYRTDEHCEDLSQAYASPPPEGPVVISATPAPHEHYLRYAHVHSPLPTSKKSMSATMLGRTAKDVMFEQDGAEFTVGIEVALGRAEEGRVMW